MEKNVEISMLCEIYGKLLTKKQLNILEDYYNQDLSLSEIALNNNITRQAVRDILKKGEKKLFEYEKKLKIMKKTLKQKETITQILSEIIKMKTELTDKQYEQILKNIKTKINSLE